MTIETLQITYYAIGIIGWGLVCLWMGLLLFVDEDE